MNFYSARVAAAVALLLAGDFYSRAEGLVANCTEQALRSALAGGGLVSFSSDCSITVTQSIYINAGNTTIDANGHQVTISGGGRVPILNVASNLTLIGLTLANGNSTNGGGALTVNPGATVLALQCNFSSNSVTAPNGIDGAPGGDAIGRAGDGHDGTVGGWAVGGAIWNRGTLSLISCTVSNNTATAGNGGKGGNGGAGTGTLGQGGNGGSGAPGGASYGGAIYNAGDLTLTNCTVAGNTSTAGNGGAGGAAGTGPYVGRPGQGGAGNSGDGGAIYNALNITIQNCTLSGNTSRGGNSATAGTQSSGTGNPGIKGGDALGGGFFNAWWGSLVNSTFYSNASRGGSGGNGGNGTGTFPTAGRGGDGGDSFGGGLHNSGTLSTLSCTLASCGAFGGTNGVAGSGTYGGGNGNPGHALGGNISSTGGSCTLHNSLIIWEQFGGCGYGTFADGGYNMTSDNTIALGGLSFPNTSNPRAGAFGMHGGSTATLPLLAGSPAIDKIPIDPGIEPPLDQRGVPRLNGMADIGAYESELTSAPLILQQPVDQTNTQSSPVTFSTSAIGASPLHYQWLFQGNPITNATGKSYTVTSASLTNLGPYRVVVSNGFGTNSSNEAFIRLSPSITAQPTNQVAVAGANVTLSVNATGEPPLAYQWQLNGTNLDGATTSVLQLTNVQVPNIGAYTVAISNISGITVVSSVATLNLRPTILSQPSSQTLAPGGQAVLAVSAVGTPPLSYQWVFNGLPVSGATLSALTNSSVQVSNAGFYFVTITNSFGVTNSAAVNLSVVLGLTVSVTEGTNGLPGVSLGVGTNPVVVTGPDGAYSTSLPPGIYRIVPALTNYAFFPAELTIVIQDVADEVNFVAVPIIRIARDTNNLVQLSGGGIPGLSYLIEASTNLFQWQILSTNVAPVDFTDPATTNLPARFYRFRR